MTDFVLNRPDRHSEPSEWGLAWRRGGRDNGPALHLVAERLALDDVAAVLAVRPPGGQRLARLLDAQPRGTLRAFDLQVLQRPSTDWWWSAAGKLDGGALTGGGAVPSVENLTLDFAAGSEGGRVSLATQGAELRAPGVLRRAITLDELGGAVTWRAATCSWGTC